MLIWEIQQTNNNMVKKKSVKKISKKTGKKVVVKRATTKAKKKSVKKAIKKFKKVRASKRKINLVLNNLILFAVLSLASFLLYRVSSDELLINLFYLLAMVLGFVAGAFLIILLIFFFMRMMNK